LLSGAVRLGWFGEFIELDVNQKSKPKTLKKMKNEPLFSIQKAKANEITVCKIQSWSNVPRELYPTSLQPQCPLIGRA
jgi:hypothetical protein